MRNPLPHLLLALWIPVAAPSAGAQETVSVLPFDEVREGMRGVGRTVFEGSRIEEFQVEILGILPDIGPDQDLILARCSGGPLSETGVLSGMSGSPVYVDGRLVGAVAYSWGFSKDAIAGITPAREMLAIGRTGTGPAPGNRILPASEADLGRLRSPPGLAAFFEHLGGNLSRQVGDAVPLSIPLAVSGLGAAGLAHVSPGLSRAGFLPVQGGGSGSEPGDTPRLEPGSPVGIKLVRGDIEMTATGTVTWSDGKRVLAFGHPLFGLGRVDLPMTGARVEALLPSTYQSARMARPLGEVGAIREDRAAGVAGVVGERANMIPVRLQYTDGLGNVRDYAFDLADDPLLAPILLYYSLNGVLASRDRSFGSVTLRIGEGSVIKMVGQEDVALDNLFSGPTATYYATGTVAYILHLLVNNVWAPPRIAGVNLRMEYEAAPTTARVERVTLDRYRVRPGDPVGVDIVLQPYRGPAVSYRSEIEIPRETPPGPLEVHVGGALSVSRADARQEPILPTDLSQFIRLVNLLRRNDRVYVVALSDDDGVFLGGARMPNLPPSVAAILSRPKSRGNFAAVPRRALLEVQVPTEYAVTGSARVQLEVGTP